MFEWTESLSGRSPPSIKKISKQVSHPLFLMLFGKPWLLLLTKNLAMLNFYFLKSYQSFIFLILVCCIANQLLMIYQSFANNLLFFVLHS